MNAYIRSRPAFAAALLPFGLLVAGACGDAGETGGTSPEGGAPPQRTKDSGGGHVLDAPGGDTRAPQDSGGPRDSGGPEDAGAPGDTGGDSSARADAGGCGVVPINPKATQQARNLLCYLYEEYGNHVLSGQQETSWATDPDVDTDYIFSTTGQYPVIRGGDFLYPGCCTTTVTPTTTRAEDWWNAGGVPMLCYHMGAPPNADSYANSMIAATGGIDAVLDPTTASYTSFIQKLDYAAAQLEILQAANVAVLWRPFHEASGSWFWWSKETGAQYVRLWTFMYDYFTNTKGLNNLVWLHPYDGSPVASFYPGKEYVDVGGGDTYATNEPFSSLFDSTKTIVGGTVPLALHENGLMPNPTDMFTGGAAPWILFNTWAGYEMPATTPGNTVTYVQSVYADSHTISRSMVPSLK